MKKIVWLLMMVMMPMVMMPMVANAAFSRNVALDAEDDRHRNNPFADEAELEDAGFEYVAEDEVNADFAGDDQED